MIDVGSVLAVAQVAADELVSWFIRLTCGPAIDIATTLPAPARPGRSGEEHEQEQRPLEA